MKGRQSYLAGALIISAGGFISKILGAVYRVPLARFLGGEGMGIYQMVYPLYCILLTISASGIPTGIARLISSGARGAERRAFYFYGALGLIGTLVMYALSEPLSLILGEPAVSLCCKLLCPSVFFVSVLSVARGYFQGLGNMYPTAVSEAMEQAIKVGLGCALSYIFRADVARAVASTLFAVTVSEIFVTFGVVLKYIYSRPKKPLFREPVPPLREVLAYTFPLMLTAIAQPLSQFAESVLAVRLIGGAQAAASYGVYSGCALTVVNLPAAVTYGLAASIVPQISPLAQGKNYSAAKSRAYKSLILTLALSSAAAVCLALCAPLAADILFGSLTESQRALFILLVRILSPSAVTISLAQTSSACLAALGYPKKSAASQWIAAAVRVSFCAALIKFTPLGISGAAIAANCSYFVAALINFCYIIRVGGGNENNVDRSWRFGRRLDAEGKSGA